MNDQIYFQLKEAFLLGYNSGVAEEAPSHALDEFDRLFKNLTVCPKCERNLTRSKDLCNDCIDSFCAHEPEMSHSEHGYVHCKKCGIELPEDFKTIEQLIEETHPL